MNSFFKPFNTDISKIELPNKFTYPFNYTPHKISEIAAQELQYYISTQSEWIHNFGLSSDGKKSGIGKMFGVLVCKDINGNLGQLWAFSGKLANSNQLSNFVPTVFDMLTQEGFYKKGETVLNNYNAQIKILKADIVYLNLLSEKQQLITQSNNELVVQKQRIKMLKKNRQQKRKEAIGKLLDNEIEALNIKLNEESKKENIILKKMNKYWNETLKENANKIAVFTNQIDHLKQQRKQKSALLQQQLFEQYTFLNVKREAKSLGAIFDNNPPAGAGECCAPKLLHYAFSNKLTPVAMAEFWWGKSPSSEVRKHKNFYPSCRSKCEPILQSHMLVGLQVDTNPLEAESKVSKEIEIVYDDPFIAVINKPSGLLSVPGKRIKNSVYTQLQKIYPQASGPLLVHRLDRATSGLLLMAKNLPTYINLQKQFTNRLVKKRYIALLDGLLNNQKGEINLPLRVDLDNRPQQLVCFKHGKAAKTIYEVFKIDGNRTLVYFFPITGRTHQLRVHSAHFQGLNAPIIGDDLYGKKNERLFLHADYIEFKHPESQKNIKFHLKCDFT